MANLLRRVGEPEIVPVANENTGRVGGYQIKHWDGRVDAIIRPETIRRKVQFRPVPLEQTEGGLILPAGVRSDG
jgi:hypothetical protein